MAGLLVTEQSLEKTLRQVLELTCAALPGGDGGGITLLEAEGPATAFATSASSEGTSPASRARARTVMRPAVCGASMRRFSAVSGPSRERTSASCTSV